MPRIAPVTGKSDVRAEHHHVVDAVIETFGNVRGPFSVLLHSPGLAERVLPLVKFFREESVVEAPLRSIAILTAVREREAAYVWAAQVGAARRAGAARGGHRPDPRQGRSGLAARRGAGDRDLRAPAHAHQPRRRRRPSTRWPSATTRSGWSS